MNKMVVVGEGHELSLFSESLFGFIKKPDWHVIECKSISTAKEEKPDLLLVFAHTDRHVAGFSGWTNHPPTIWFCFSMRRIVPQGATFLLGPVTAQELLLKCREILG